MFCRNIISGFSPFGNRKRAGGRGFEGRGAVPFDNERSNTPWPPRERGLAGRRPDWGSVPVEHAPFKRHHPSTECEDRPPERPNALWPPRERGLAPKATGGVSPLNTPPPNATTPQRNVGTAPLGGPMPLTFPPTRRAGGGACQWQASTADRVGRRDRPALQWKYKSVTQFLCRGRPLCRPAVHLQPRADGKAPKKTQKPGPGGSLRLGSVHWVKLVRSRTV